MKTSIRAALGFACAAAIVAPVVLAMFFDLTPPLFALFTVTQFAGIGAAGFALGGDA